MEGKQKVELLNLSQQILALTEQVHSRPESLVDRKAIEALTEEVHSVAGSLRERR